jgi:hypothetical protein
VEQGGFPRAIDAQNAPAFSGLKLEIGIAADLLLSNAYIQILTL